MIYKQFIQSTKLLRKHSGPLCPYLTTFANLAFAKFWSLRRTACSSLAANDESSVTNQRFQEWEVLLVIQAKQRDKNGLLRNFNALASMPQFSGVREQSLKLMRTANHYLEKFGSTPLPIPMLPKMRMIKLWDDEAEI